MAKMAVCGSDYLIGYSAGMGYISAGRSGLVSCAAFASAIVQAIHPLSGVGLLLDAAESIARALKTVRNSRKMDCEWYVN